MSNKMLKYEMSEQVVNILLTVLDRTQTSGVQNARNLIAIVELLQKPLNAEDLEKEQMEMLLKKFEAPKEKKKDEKVPTEK